MGRGEIPRRACGDGNSLFTRDLRVNDNPVLAAAAGAEFTVPLFVMDTGIERIGFAVPRRARFLAECLTDLDRALRARGGALVVGRGNLIEEVLAVAELNNAAALAALRRRLVVHEGVHTVVAPGVVTPAGSARLRPKARRGCRHICISAASPRQSWSPARARRCERRGKFVRAAIGLARFLRRYAPAGPALRTSSRILLTVTWPITV